MLAESNIDESFLKDVIREKFGIRLVNLTLVPKWEAARGYMIESSTIRASSSRFTGITKYLTLRSCLPTISSPKRA